MDYQERTVEHGRQSVKTSDQVKHQCLMVSVWKHFLQVQAESTLG